MCIGFNTNKRCIMKIGILNRPDIEALATRPFKEKTALISITDYDDVFAELENKPEYLFQIKFDDVDNDHPYDEKFQDHKEAYEDMEESEDDDDLSRKEKKLLSLLKKGF